MKNNIQKLNNGYAILFAVVIVSIISMIAIGLSNTTYKQLILSSLANDSQLAFYQSDTATECALYADNIVGLSLITSPWLCGKNDVGNNYSFAITFPDSLNTLYKFTSNANGSTTPCFDFDIDKITSPATATNIYAKGYNSCVKTSIKTVQREIKVSY